jgi:hypothetical protein
VKCRELVQKGLQPPVLVFVQTKERAQELFKELLYDGIHVDVIHSERYISIILLIHSLASFMPSQNMKRASSLTLIIILFCIIAKKHV